MKLTWRFIMLIAALLASVAASATFGLRALNHLDGALDGVVKGDMERLLAITHTRRLFRSMVVLERDYLLSSSADERALLERKLGTTNQELLAQLNKYARLMPASDAAAIADIRGVRERWLEINARVLSAGKVGSSEAVTLSGLHAKDPVSWETVIGGLVKANEQRLSHEVAGTHQTYLGARATLLGASALAALVAAGLGSVIFLGIRSNLQQVYEFNANLETKVQTRTLALAEREQSLRLVLDSTGDGIVGVDKSGELAGSASAAATHWFGVATPGAPAAGYLFAGDPQGEALFKLGLGQLLDDIMPWQVAVDQMPRRLLRGELILDLSYKLVPSDDKLALLVVARDVTARVHSEHAEQEARERQGLVAKLLLDKHGFSSFVRDAEHLLATLDGETDAVLAQRALHTLKGNVAVYGLSTMARLCHKIEERLADSGGLPLELEVAGLKKHLRDNLRGIEDFLTNLGRDVYEVPSVEHAALVQSLVDRKDYPELLQMVEVWTWPRASERLSRLRAEAEYLAKRLGKQLRVVVEHNDLRLPEGYLEQFWPTLTHVLRNAVDHGVESPEQRAQAGKAPEGRLWLRASLVGGALCLDVDDDGAGVDLPELRRAAQRHALAVRDDASDLDLIFRDGVSTRSTATDISGRGIGLAATRAACQACGGSVTVQSEAGGGTRFRFRFRQPVVDTLAIEARREPRWKLAPEASATPNAKAAPKLRLAPASKLGTKP